MSAKFMEMPALGLLCIKCGLTALETMNKFQQTDPDINARLKQGTAVRPCNGQS